MCVLRALRLRLWERNPEKIPTKMPDIKMIAIVAIAAGLRSDGRPFLIKDWKYIVKRLKGLFLKHLIWLRSVLQGGRFY